MADYTITLNLESAKLLYDGLDNLPADKKRTILYNNLRKNLKVIITLRERQIKNEQIIQDERRKLKSQKGSRKK